MKKMMDANTSVSKIAYKCSEIAYIYPITPSSPMAEMCDELKNKKELNIFNKTLKIVEMQSEAGVSGSLHGSALAGALTTTFTSSQGLLLMIPNMYKIAGELLPTVFHVASRSLATHALNIFCDHSDVMATRQTGFAMLCSNNSEEAQDFALASHITTLKSRVPFLHFFDGFRTSHEISKVEEISSEQIKKLIPFDKIEEFKSRAMNPCNPKQFGTTQNPDVYFQNRELVNSYYENVPNLLKETFNKIEKVTGRKYNLFDYYGNENAENIIISLGSSSETIEDYINKTNIKDLGVIKVRLFRPFSIKDFISHLPKSAKNIVVLDRTKECGATGEPLYLDVVNALNESDIRANIFNGRYGLGGKEFNLDMVHSIYKLLKENKLQKHFTVGINDDKTNLSINIEKLVVKDNCYSCLFYGLGSDGTVSANKNSIKIIGDNTNLFAQGFFEYDSKKSGSMTTSHLKISKEKILSHEIIKNADLIAIHNERFLNLINVFKNLKQNGTVLINSSSGNLSDISNHNKKVLFDKNAQIYIIDAEKLAHQNNLDNKINTIMQTAFFKLTNFIDFKKAKIEIKNSINKTYINKGKDVVENNEKIVDLVENNLIKFDLPTDWQNISDIPSNNKIDNQYFSDFINPILQNDGNKLKVSQMSIDGVPTGTSKYEKRNIATSLPVWIPENCIQCGQCAFVCPHGAIRPIIVNDNELIDTPPSFKSLSATNLKNARFILQISPKDCTGCKNCVITCPSLKKALEMKKNKEVINELENNYNYSQSLTKLENPFDEKTIKGSQFNLPYFEYSGACSGCGETTYIKILSQLFGERMLIANATGCSSIYGGSCPTCPYTKDEYGCGPTWANSLFEDNAEFGLGMKLANDNLREAFEEELKTRLANFENKLLTNILNDWLINKDNAKESISIFKQLKLLLNQNLEEKTENLEFIKNNLKHITKKSQWIIGGDGWAYDIGFGGLDHVLSTNENVNVLVLDTEVYSNTGGQSSKSTPLGASAKFNQNGKKTAKKNLAKIFMTYKNVYVAQVAIGADKNQLLKALIEAEAYNGPSIIIAYSTCINHGLKENSLTQMKNAVDSGYFHLFRYNPNNEKPFTLDSKEPNLDLISHLQNEKRFLNVQNNNKLLDTIKENAKDLYLYYKKLEENQ